LSSTTRPARCRERPGARSRHETAVASGPDAAGPQTGAMDITWSGGQEGVKRHYRISPSFADPITDWFTREAGPSNGRRMCGMLRRRTRSRPDALSPRMSQVSSGRALSRSGEALEQTTHPWNFIDLFGVPLDRDQKPALR